LDEQCHKYPRRQECKDGQKAIQACVTFRREGGCEMIMAHPQSMQSQLAEMINLLAAGGIAASSLFSFFLSFFHTFALLTH